MELLIVTPGEAAESIRQRVTLARQLGHDEIIVCYSRHDQRNKETTPPGTISAILVTTTNQAKALKRSYDQIVAPCKREFFESPHVDAILEPERQARQDFIHHRNSGLHQVLLKLCQPTSKRRQAKRIITTTRLLLDANVPAVILGRMMQNARWCRKYNVAYHVTSGARTVWEQRAASDLAALRRELEKSRAAA